MSLMYVVLTLVVIGVLLGLLNKFIDMDGKIKTIINVVVVLCVVFWLLNVFGFNLNVPITRPPR